MILGITLLLTLLNVFTPSSYATDWIFIPDIRVTWDESFDWAPSIAQAQDERIWFVWHSYKLSNPDVLYKIYNGSSTFPWSPTKKLTTDPGYDISPSITTTTDGNIWVVWSSNRNGNYDIYYKVYDGVSWSSYNNLTADPNEDESPSITQTSNGTIWLSWSTNRNGNYDIYYKTSIDNGTTWSPDTPLPNQPVEDDKDPSIVGTADGGIRFVWERNDDIHYKSYNGTEWSPDDTLTTDPIAFDWHPSIMQASNDDIWVVWDSDRISGQADIYCKVYNGVDWLPYTQLTFNTAEDSMPSIMQDTNGTIWIAWTSWRQGNSDIYYKTDPPPEHDHDVAIVSVTHDPNVTVAYQGLNISIEIVPQNQGMIGETVQTNCSASSTLIGSQTRHLGAGHLMPLTFEWNTSSVIPGVYTIIATATINGQTDTDPADNTFIDGEVYVKISGDVNGDKVVDVYDLSDLGKAYGSELGDSNWNQDCDFNRDNKVDASDLFDLNENYGKTI